MSALELYLSSPLGEHRVPLQDGLTRIGGPDCDIPLEGFASWGRGEVHVWSDPLKVVVLAAEPRPLLNGSSTDGSAFFPGDKLSWGPWTLRAEGGDPLIEEVPLAPPPSKRSGSGSGKVVLGGAWPQAWKQVYAGLLVEQGLVPSAMARRWQDAVVRREFDPAAFAREVLAEPSTTADDPRLISRSGELARDLLMTPLTRGVQGASRRARRAAKGGAAFFVAQMVVLAIFALIVLVVMFLVRAKWDVSYDGLFDSILGKG